MGLGVQTDTLCIWGVDNISYPLRENFIRSVGDNNNHLGSCRDDLGDEVEGFVISELQIVQAKTDKFVLSKDSEHIHKSVHESDRLGR